VNTLQRASVASLALASVADARSQIARSISLSSDGVVVKHTWTKYSERMVAMGEVNENTDHRYEVILSSLKLSVFLVTLVAHITDIRITPLGALVVG